MADWQTKSSEIVYETPWIRVYRDEVLDQNGNPLTYSYVETQNPSVLIVAVDIEAKILLQSVYRYPTKKRLWEIPAGFTNSGEDFLNAAKREFKEESGLVSDDWQALGRIQKIAGTGNVASEIFLARNVQRVGKATDEEEDIKNQQFKSLHDIETMITNGELVDSSAITAIYKAKLHGLTKEE